MMIPEGHHLTEDEVTAVNRTARNWADTCVYRAFRHRAAFMSMLTKGATVLDFGSGKLGHHLHRIRDMDINITGYDIGENFDPKIHDEDALDKRYDVVLASNVLNVQPQISALQLTLYEIQSATKLDGILIFNYPAEPRKIPEIKLADIVSWFRLEGWCLVADAIARKDGVVMFQRRESFTSPLTKNCRIVF